MAWTLEFNEADGKNIGQLAAVWNAGLPDELRFEKSVNLSDEGSVSDFIAEAEKYLAIKLAYEDKISPALTEIAVRMNK